MKGLQGIVFLLILIVITPILLLFAWIASLTEEWQGEPSQDRAQNQESGVSSQESE
ncbi:hypothetical protein IQ238_07425 [Pleurocapsales cyanobacterium LEGE 06147]|nr:hypothetical protein [Pleurocapsales cyanobacterium LEGE 06147]